MPSPKLSQLRARVAALEGIGHDVVAGVVSLGVPEMDAGLPWGGLPLGCLHEVSAAPGLVEDGAALGFTAHMLGRLTASRSKPVLWVAGTDDLYAPGLAGLDLPASRLVVVRPVKAAHTLWALEEAVRCKALAAVLGDVRSLDFTAARRLQLAARESGVTALILNRGQSVGTAVTRWRVGPLPSLGPAEMGVGAWRWRIELTRCRGRGLEEASAVWEVEWCDETRALRVSAAPASGRAAEPARRAHRFRDAG